MEALGPGDPPAVGGYALLGRLGAGGMGAVYLGRGPGGELAAVKVVHPAFALQGEFRARFAREVQALRAVHGPFTAALLDADAQAATPWLAMQYVPGPTLEAAVDGSGPLPAGQVLLLAVGIAGALEMLHRAGWVHRDLKPGNVILSADGPRVIDLGVAHAVGATALTQTGAVVGTRTWMAPEQLSGAGEAATTDMFAWACLVGFAATGRHPFGAGRPEAVWMRILHEEPDLLGLAHLDAALIDCVTRALAKDPAQRPSAGQVLAAVTHHPSGEATLLDHAGSAVASGWPAQGPQPVPAPGPAPGPADARSGPAVTRAAHPTARADAGPADALGGPASPGQPVGRRGRRVLAVSMTLLVLAVLGGGLFLLLGPGTPAAPGRREPPRAGTPSAPATSAAPAGPPRSASSDTAGPTGPADDTAGQGTDETAPGGLEPIGPTGGFPLGPRDVQATLVSRTTHADRTTTIKGIITRADAIEYCTRLGSNIGADTPAKVAACADEEMAAERGEVYEATAKCAQEQLRPPPPRPKWRHDDPDRSTHWWRLAVPDGEEGWVGDAAGEYGTAIGPVWQDTTTGELADASSAGGGYIMWLQFQLACDPQPGPG